MEFRELLSQENTLLYNHPYIFPKTDGICQPKENLLVDNHFICHQAKRTGVFYEKEPQETKTADRFGDAAGNMEVLPRFRGKSHTRRLIGGKGLVPAGVSSQGHAGLA